MLNLRLVLLLVAVALVAIAIGVWQTRIADGLWTSPTRAGVETGAESDASRESGPPGAAASGADPARGIVPSGPSAPAQGERVALVIGNGAYKVSPLANPVNDATDIATALRGFGFRVIGRTDLNTQGMRDAIREFRKELRGANAGLFYYAGHGVQIKGENYLVPINEDIRSEAEAEDRTIRMGYVLGELEGAQVKVSIVILDACRDNPFARGFRSGARGLAQMDAASGGLIAFATSPGKVADDGADRNGIYTKHLLASLRHDDTDILRVFNRATEDVYTETGGKQRPWFSTSLIGDFYFNPTKVAGDRQSVPPPLPVPDETPSATPPAPVAADPDATERLFWESVKDSRKKAELELYLNAYPNGRFAPLAHARLEELKRQVSQAPPKPPTQTPPAQVPPLKTTSPAAPANADQSYQGAQEARRRGDVVGAVALYRKAAEQGHIQAQVALGSIYLKGARGMDGAPGIQADAAESVRWFRRAAERGDARAQAQLGHYYSSGAPGVPKDDAEAVRWYRRAAEQGDPVAQYFLGLRYRRGEGVPRDYAEALTWLRKAAEQNHVLAQTAVGEIFAKGATGIPRDEAEAVKWYRKAAAQGYAPAQAALDWYLKKRDQGVRKDDPSALQQAARPTPATTADQIFQAAQEALRARDIVGAVALYRQAAEQGHVPAQISLGNIYSKGSSSVPRDDAEAASWYRKAAEQGDARAQAILGQMYSTGLGVPRHGKEAAMWYHKAAEQGHVGAQYALGIMYLKDEVTAVKWLRQAAERGHVGAQINLGRIYEKGGQAVPRDEAEAVRWYRMAAAQGDAYAQQSLARLGVR
jgi:TPR repeat protein/uncharacterized caspase-like protein